MDEASRAQITEYTSNRVAAADPVQLTIEEVCLRTGYNAAAVGSCITALFDMGLVRYVLYCSMLLLHHNLTPTSALCTTQRPLRDPAPLHARLTPVYLPPHHDVRFRLQGL
jgi:hypothetical protein